MLLIAATFIGLIASGIVLPLVLFLIAIGLLIFRYWEAIKAFDFWAFDEWARARMNSVGVREWHTPYHAAEHFCDPKIVKARNDAAGTMNIIMMELIRDRGRNDADPNGTSPLRLLEKERPKPFSGGTGLRELEYETAQENRDKNNLALAQDLLKQLAVGDLLAKGLPTHNGTTHSERIIPTSRWRVMRLNISKAEASGHGLHYIGIVIGKKPKR